MRSRIFICIIFIFPCWLTSANLAKAQGEKATVGSSPVVKKPATPTKKTAPVKTQSGSFSSKTSAAKKTPQKKKTSSGSKSAAKTTDKPKSDDEIVITIQDNNSLPGGAGLGGESMKACRYYLGSGLYDKWQQMGGESGRLGCPMMNEIEAGRSPQGTIGRMTQFSKDDGGYIIWHGSGTYSGTSFEVSGCMFKLYSSIGGTGSWLGFPVKDGYVITTGARQDFEGGYILWDSKTYVCQAYRY
jgi:hypothetical protein